MFQSKIALNPPTGPQNHHLIAYKIGENVDSISIISSIIETNGNIDLSSIKSFLRLELKLDNSSNLKILSVSKLGLQ